MLFSSAWNQPGSRFPEFLKQHITRLTTIDGLSDSNNTYIRLIMPYFQYFNIFLILLILCCSAEFITYE